MAAKKIKKPRLELERRIQFFKMSDGFRNDGTPKPINIRQALQNISNLSPEEKYLETGDDEKSSLYVWDDSTKTEARIIFGKYRMQGLSELGDKKGKLSPIPVPDDGGLVEKSHLIFFSNNIIGVEGNWYGPSIYKLREYFVSKSNAVSGNFRISALIDPFAIRQLRQMSDVRLFQFKIRADATEALASVNRTLADAFDAQARISGAEELEVILKLKPHSQESLNQSFVETIKKLTRSRKVIDGTKTMKVKGYNDTIGRVETLDLLNEHLISVRRVARQDPQSRAVEKNAMFKAIREAYEEKIKAINAADIVDPAED